MTTSIEFEVDLEPCFSNEMYRAVKSKAKGWAVTAKTNKLIKYQRAMRELLPQAINPDEAAAFKYAFDTGIYDIQVESIHYIHYKRFYDMDASNLIKAHEDCVAKFLGIDDKYTSKYIVEKVPTEVDIGWKVHTKMTLVKKNPITEAINR